MSASSKKKLQKELNATKMTEKQLAEKKEAKKLKAYTISFVAVILVFVLVAVALVAVKGINSSGLIERFTVAAVVDDHEINSVELNYYYTDIIQSTLTEWENTYGDQLELYTAMMGLDLSKPLNEQAYDDERTWADYFLDSALERAAGDHILYNAAKAAGFTLPESDQATLDSKLASLNFSAQMWGYSNLSQYLKGLYGFGSSEKSYKAYTEKSALATAYYNDHSASLTYNDDEIREYEADKYNQYSSYSFASHYISYTDYLEGGTQDAEGNTTYTDEEKLAARSAAKEAAEELAKCTTTEEFDNAIAAMDASDSEEKATSTKSYDTLYTNINALYADWLADSQRKAGDISYFANENATTDESGNEIKTTNGYYIVMYLSRDENLKNLANVRHLLVQFEGGTQDSDGNTTYSDEEKATAKAEAEKLLNTWKSGDATEESFAALAKDNSDDSGSAENGGLIEDILPMQGIYVENFTNWAIDDVREAGDCEIIETEHGYHIMYYAGDDEMTFRDYLISSDIRTEDMSEWFDGKMENVKYETKNTSRLNMAVTLSQ